MQVLRSADYKRMPWKNGKGETVEIAVFPPDASVEKFDWRISTAAVVADGPFSTFDEIDRTLSVLTGEGIELTVADHPPVLCYRHSDPYTFPADETTTARLVGDPITDLNVMSRRGHSAHRVVRHSFDRELEVGSHTAEAFIIFASPCEIKNTGDTLEYLDAIHLDPGEKATVQSTGPAIVFVVEVLVDMGGI
ncbi:HutD family protein [Agrobacterium rhizogenes]|uniref:HutD/Ves family protein n=1 Tax=Rhizobium rhizogenes TaxID=359 RepID=UPI00157162AF|nr:HutD family protein [Rhizobium rhizogenes]NTF91522.1 HutD family protein [Rhizobium rhizogenes]